MPGVLAGREFVDELVGRQAIAFPSVDV